MLYSRVCLWNAESKGEKLGHRHYQVLSVLPLWQRIPSATLLKIVYPGLKKNGSKCEWHSEKREISMRERLELGGVGGEAVLVSAGIPAVGCRHDTGSAYVY